MTEQTKQNSIMNELPEPKLCKDCGVIVADINKSLLCKNCWNKRYLKTEKGREIRRRSHKKYYWKNPEYHRKRLREWYRKNKDKVRKKQKEWYNKNRLRHLEYCRNYHHQIRKQKNVYKKLEKNKSRNAQRI